MSRITVDALVGHAEGPDKGFMTGRQRLVLAVPLPSGHVVRLEEEPKVEWERLLVRGMTVPVEIDPDKPRGCDVILDGVPPLDQRIAENDWTLCDLEEVGVRVRMAKFEIERSAAAAQGVPMDDVDARRAQYAQQLEEWKQHRRAVRPQAPLVDAEGRLRGTADLISFERKPSSRQSTSGAHQAGWRGKRLYRLWICGEAPRAVVDVVHFPGGLEKRRATLLEGGDVEVTVDPADRSDIAFFWDEHRVDRARMQQVLSGVLAAWQAGTLDATALNTAFYSTPTPMRSELIEQLRARGLDVSAA